MHLELPPPRSVSEIPRAHILRTAGPEGRTRNSGAGVQISKGLSTGFRHLWSGRIRRMSCLSCPRQTELGPVCLSQQGQVDKCYWPNLQTVWAHSCGVQEPEEPPAGTERLLHLMDCVTEYAGVGAGDTLARGLLETHSIRALDIRSDKAPTPVLAVRVALGVSTGS